jgi:hypothetical protein
MRKGGVWFYIYTTDYELYSVTWPAEEEEEDLGDLLISDVQFYNSAHLAPFTADLYKKTLDDGTELYTFKEFLKDYNLQFTLDESSNMVFVGTNPASYAGYSYEVIGPDWNTSYPMYLTAEPDYYLDYTYFSTYPGYSVLHLDANWGCITMFYAKTNATTLEYVSGSWDYVYITWGN